eukprot:gnl/MRDRNA2_/MRDRNA2_96005_c0_seq1.p1 gnl/MRDRNA2_/MRDRNA2_96005_c0~~gnl/MRDRNA2_/MRDRNA2_96005_c0_seq1.p1  ORF type:complete len:324 (+),score=32.88 gnl/MRDRNA2_/MRDRNA2_96005_c0_seq1:108-1079(+)
MVSVCSVLVVFSCMYEVCSLRLQHSMDIGIGCQQMSNNLCHPSPQSQPLLITGMGGSGTHTIQNIFALNDINLGHESVEAEGSVSWPYAVDAIESKFNFKTCPQSWLRPPKTTFNHVVHLVRCPREVVSALQSHQNCSLKYMRDTLKLDFEDDKLRTPQFLMSAWLRWNQHIEDYADSRYRIDEFMNQDNFITICNLAGFHHGDDLVLPTAHQNHRHHDSFTWAQLRSADEGLARQLHDKAREYGFLESCLDDDISLDEEEYPIGADTTFTLDEDGIIWYWKRASMQNVCAREKCFENFESARQHLELTYNITLSKVASEMGN